jgi:hypothetical protein
MPGCFATVPSGRSGQLTLFRTCGPRLTQRMSDRKSVGSDGGRAGNLGSETVAGCRGFITTVGRPHPGDARL